MLPATNKKASKIAVRKVADRSSRIKHADIVDDAIMLGVERTHLYRVLEGKRQSASLLARYQQLQEDKKNQK